LQLRSRFSAVAKKHGKTVKLKQSEVSCGR
jgi:hypothetical protein